MQEMTNCFRAQKTSSATVHSTFSLLFYMFYACRCVTEFYITVTKVRLQFMAEIYEGT